MAQTLPYGWKPSPDDPADFGIYRNDTIQIPKKDGSNQFVIVDLESKTGKQVWFEKTSDGKKGVSLFNVVSPETQQNIKEIITPESKKILDSLDPNTIRNWTKLINLSAITIIKDNNTPGTAQEIATSLYYKSANNIATAPVAAPLGSGNVPNTDSDIDSDIEDKPDKKIKSEALDPKNYNLDYNDNVRFDYGEDMQYPEELNTTAIKQDVIRFTAFKYSGRGINEINTDTLVESGKILGERTFTEKIQGTVTLPIQPTISDTNSVRWGGQEIGPVNAYLATTALKSMDNPTAMIDALTSVADLADDSDVGKALKLALAGKAAGVNGLLSRVGGAVLNPNLELLFEGPQLRPFSFTFRLSAREPDEAKQIKKIIRWFKQTSSVKFSSTELFMKAPFIYEIRYLKNGTDDHPSINRIKKCALQSVSVDYTPDGSYMTFNDPDRTMVSYGLTLQFSELEPVTEKDYQRKGLADTHIGY